MMSVNIANNNADDAADDGDEQAKQPSTLIRRRQVVATPQKKDGAHARARHPVGDDDDVATEQRKPREKADADSDADADADGNLNQTEEEHSKTLTNAATGASWSILLQVVLRLVTFISNGLIIRMSSTHMLGIVNVRLLLLYSTVVFLAREPLRKACLSVRSTQLTKQYWQLIVNLIWIGIASSAVIALALACVWLFWLEQPQDAAFYPIAVAAFALSAIVEVSVEPFWIFYQIKLNSKLKAIIETQSLLFGLALVILGKVMWPSLGLLIPAFAQLAKKAYIVAAYTRRLAHDINADPAAVAPVTTLKQMLFADSKAGAPWYRHYPDSVADIAVSFVRHGIVKQLLTEGERYIMTFGNMLTFAQQGVYDVVNSLGSLIPRMLFHPIEEDYYTFFAALLERAHEPEVDHGHDDGESAEGEGKDADEGRDEKLSEAKRVASADLALASTTLSTLFKLVVLIGLVFTCFGQAYSHTLLYLYGGEALAVADGVILLRAFSVYVLLLAVNGIAECFVTASSSKQELDEHNRWMFLFSFVYVLASLFFIGKHGALGFLLANGINMLMRITKACYDMVIYFDHYPAMKASGHPLTNAVPSLGVTATLFIAMYITLHSEMIFIGDTSASSLGPVPFLNIVQHVAVGGICLVGALMVIYKLEMPFIRNLRLLWKGKLQNTKKAK